MAQEQVLVPLKLARNSSIRFDDSTGAGSTEAARKLFGSTGEVGSSGIHTYAVQESTDGYGVRIVNDKLAFFVTYTATAGGQAKFTASAGGYWQASQGAMTAVELTTAYKAAFIGPFESARFKSTAGKLILTPATTSTATGITLTAFRLPIIDYST
jgi:hypothetical protein